ncbi:four helix bundle protein [Candidatus Daviesbacteria bacterium]|nr:four helix bundle protein [Candidatus Daviesbacteria bacterium]
MEAVGGYKKLIVYQKAKILVREVYAVSKNFPREELHGLTSQARRSAISIVLNIVEGYSKSSTKEFIRFLDIAIGSANELAACLELALELRFMNRDQYDQTNSIYTEVSKLLYTFQKSLKRRAQEQNN